MIRILHVLGGMGRAGAETMVMNLYRVIDRTEVQFDFMVHTEKECSYDNEIMSLGGRIYRVPSYNGKNHFQYKKEWNNFFLKHPEYKVIHGHVRSTASIYLKIAKKHGLVTISHSHNTSSGKGLSAIVKNVLQYPIRYTADYLFACSKTAGIWLFGEKACKKENFFILNNGIDTDKFVFNEDVRLRKRRELNIEDKFVIGHVGRFHPQKNHTFLIEIFNEIHKRNNNAVLLLVGEGDLINYIKNKVDNIGLRNSVIFAGNRSDVSELLQAMDIFVFPSLHEGLPVTMIEAQASGLPCVISDKITREVKITDLVKYLSINFEPTNWAEEILNFSNNYIRKNMSRDIKENSYDIETTTEWYKKFIRKCHNM